MKVPANTLSPQFELFCEEYFEAAGRVLRSGWYVLGKEVEAFEEEFARFTGSRHCVGLASGLDALILSVRTLNIEIGRAHV